MSHAYVPSGSARVSPRSEYADGSDVQDWNPRNGYSDAKLIHSGAFGKVYSAKRTECGRAVILKVFPSTAECARHAELEAKALRAIGYEGVPQEIAYEVSEECLVLVLERVPGISLRSWIESNGPAPIERVIEIARACAAALRAVHKARLVHRDVTPNNIMYDSASSQTHLIDFGIAISLGTKMDGLIPAVAESGLAGTLQYIAPEQTGRMSHGCSFQSDLYGLGGSMYFALTGKPPFSCDDARELIHAHLARVPEAPDQVRPDVPSALSRLVMKLLAKEPDERYGSATSLLNDLDILHEQLIETGELDPAFVLESVGAPDRLRFSNHLYGRAAECDRLFRAFDRAASGAPGVVLLQGSSGLGKSQMVEALRNRVGEAGGYLIRSVCSPDGKTAFAGWSQCLESFAQQILVESDDQLRAWRDRLRTELGALAGALAEIAPDLGIVVGDIPELETLGVHAGRARLLFAIQKLLASVATRDRPLVLFLDDYQSADSGTQFVAEELFTVESEGSFLVIIASNEASDAAAPRPLASLRCRLESLDVPAEHIQLMPITDAALTEMLADTLGKPQTSVTSLLELVRRKTGGNPLCIRQFFDYLLRSGLLRYETQDGWTWELESIAEASVPEGSIGLLVDRLRSLAPAHRELVDWSSFAGSVIEVEGLARLCERDIALVHTGLIELEELGLIVPCPDGFRFSHDRIREAVLDRMSGDERASRHARAAQVLLDTTPAESLSEVSLEIASHLARAGDSWPSEARFTRVELCLSAGRQAMRSGALEEARDYLQLACSEFTSDDWSSRRELGREIWLVCAEAEQLAHESERALELLEQVQLHARSDLEVARIEMQRLQVFALIRPASECITHALTVLRRFGVHWDPHPSYWRVWWAIQRLRRHVRSRALLGVKAPGGHVDARRAAVMLVIDAAGAVMARTDCRLSALATCFVLETPLPAALNVREAYSVGNYALWLQVVLQDSRAAVDLANLARSWLEQCNAPLYAARFALTFYGSLEPCVTPRRRALASLAHAALRMQERGETEFAYYSLFFKVVLGALAGNPVRESREELEALTVQVNRQRIRLSEPQRCHDAFRALCDDALSPNGQPAQDAGHEATQPGDVWSTTLHTMVLCIFGRFEELWQASERLGMRLFREAPYAHVPQHLLYRGIAAASLAAASADSRHYRRALRQALRQLRQWAKFGPDFGHMQRLLAAENARLRGRTEHAHQLYEQAARAATTDAYPHHAALAKERRAEMLFQLRRETEARHLMGQAAALYRAWGATGKAQQLEIRQQAGPRSI